MIRASVRAAGFEPAPRCVFYADDWAARSRTAYRQCATAWIAAALPLSYARIEPRRGGAALLAGPALRIGYNGIGTLYRHPAMFKPGLGFLPLDQLRGNRLRDFAVGLCFGFCRNGRSVRLCLGLDQDRKSVA